MCLREMKAAIILTFFASVGLAVSEDCPAPSTILPCSCIKTFPPKVTCTDVTDFDSIKKILVGKFTDRFILKLTNVMQKTLERGTAQTVPVFSFYIDNSPMVQSLRNDSLMDMAQYLQYVTITHTSLTSIPTAALAKLPSLLHLRCRNAKITQILKKDFDGISKDLKELDLGGNPISCIEEGAFTDFLFLKEMSLTACHLKTLTGHWLASNPMNFRLMHNQISAMPMEVISGLKNSAIYLSDNKIRQLPSEAELVKFLNKGNRLNLYGNPLQCTCDLKWILNYEPMHSAHPPLEGFCIGEGLRQHKWLIRLTADDFSDCNSTIL